MGSFRVHVVPSAEPELAAVPFPFRRQVNQRLVRLKQNPRPVDAQVIGDGEDYRLVVHGWIVLYEVAEEEALVTILAILKAGLT